MSVCELLGKLAQENLTTPIPLVLDNAKYQRCILVAELATHLGIELLYLPSYSPNFNIIRRLWKISINIPIIMINKSSIYDAVKYTNSTFIKFI